MADVLFLVILAITFIIKYIFYKMQIGYCSCEYVDLDELT